jgi:hypothetical protein
MVNIKMIGTIVLIVTWVAYLGKNAVSTPPLLSPHSYQLLGWLTVLITELRSWDVSRKLCHISRETHVENQAPESVPPTMAHPRYW